jgi:hypothetical protein
MAFLTLSCPCGYEEKVGARLDEGTNGVVLRNGWQVGPGGWLCPKCHAERERNGVSGRVVIERC